MAEEEENRQETAVELYLAGRPMKEAMAAAGYTPQYVKRWWREFIDRPSVREYMSGVVTALSGMSPERGKAIVVGLVEKRPGVDIPWREYMKAVEFYLWCTGLMRRDFGRQPTVPINIHIHREETVIEGQGTVLEGES